MPASTYYLDSIDLATAYNIYADAAMTTFAAQGYYSDGVICRYWHEITPGFWTLDPLTYCNN